MQVGDVQGKNQYQIRKKAIPLRAHLLKFGVKLSLFLLMKEYTVKAHTGRRISIHFLMLASTLVSISRIVFVSNNYRETRMYSAPLEDTHCSTLVSFSEGSFPTQQ
jgi:hypothetical protein